MDKVTCIAYLLYNSSKNQDIKEIAIQLLNGEISMRDLKKNLPIQAQFGIAESLFKKNQINKKDVQLFVEEFMTIEV
ncbi:hypothetical protein HPT25_23950 [Bacillus sp. BRMEA1]|uniref:hypothetical protein n=1 Tax=Neobacillus endophyticus TaxID=2738405 RepID=UPI0015659450|nr:hypothetical protein [Neobacillus endophyticus]NRD80378.1 hypothetical protein [Neobacillus endophyticus]